MSLFSPFRSSPESSYGPHGPLGKNRIPSYGKASGERYISYIVKVSLTNSVISQ